MTPDEMFWLAHDHLPRQSPGSPATLRTLLSQAGALPERTRIVDIGCGTGAATVPLALTTGGHVVGIDTHEPFLERLRADADAAGVGARVETLAAPMQAIPLPDACADLVWSEGSAYIMGFDTALASWRRLLAPGGTLVVTEAVWTTADPAPAARAFWDAGYPAMRDTSGTMRAATDAGWTVADTHLLPDSDWDAYYAPLAARVEQLRREHPDAGAALDAVDEEIAVRREHGTDYGYAAFILRRS